MQMRTIRPFERLEGFEHFERMLLIVSAVLAVQPVQVGAQHAAPAVGDKYGFVTD
jgi:hypothetical protein